MRTLPVFFEVIELLLKAGVTTVAEAAFQDHVWRPRLAPLLGLATVRIVHCAVDAEVVFEMLDGQAQGRLRDEQRLRRAREAAMHRDRDKRADMANRKTFGR